MQQRESDYRSARLTLLFFCLCLLIVAVLTGCSTWYEPSPELDYWKCIEVTGSYVKCEHLEMVR